MNKCFKILTAFLALACLVSSCTKDGEEDKEMMGKINISLGLRNANDPKALENQNDPVIKTIRIMVFGSSGIIECNQRFDGQGEGAKMTTSTFQVTTRVGSRKTVYVVANEDENPEVKAQLEKILFSSDFSTMLQGERTPMFNGESATQNLPHMLIGRSSNLTVANEGSSNPTIELKRTYAKMVLNIENVSDKEVKINSVKILNLSKNSYLNEKNMTEDSWLYDYDMDYLHINNSPSPLGSKGNGASKISPFSNRIDLYEQVGHGSQSKKSPELIVDAVFDGVKTTYKALIAKDEPDIDGQFQILRNRYYIINAKISKLGETDGITVTTNVLPWNDGGNQDWKATMSYATSLNDQSVDNTPHEYNISQSSPLTFKIKIKGENVGDQFKVVLSDGFNFKLNQFEMPADNSEQEFTINAVRPTYGIARVLFVSFTVNGRYVTMGENNTTPLRLTITQIVE